MTFLVSFLISVFVEEGEQEAGSERRDATRSISTFVPPDRSRGVKTLDAVPSGPPTKRTLGRTSLDFQALAEARKRKRPC